MSWRLRFQAGLSLVELMVALAIGAILMLGVVQVFGASRTAYQLSEGMSRAQENARFALDFLQRDIRMAGHFGCVNDQAHVQNPPSSLHALFAADANGDVVDPRLDFGWSIQGFEATGTAPGNELEIVADPAQGATGFNPLLPPEFLAATSNRVAGSDILALRFLAPEGVPVTSVGGSVGEPSFGFDPSRWEVLRSGVSAPGLFGVADCLHAAVFQASSISGGTIEVKKADLNASAFSSGFTSGQATLYRAVSIVYYVGNNGRGGTSLYRARFDASPGAGLTSERDEMVEGIDNLQLLFGQDRVLDTAQPPTGFIDRHLTADAVSASLPKPRDAWRRVGAVQVGLLTSSPERAAAQAPQADDTLRAVGVVYEVPDDGRFRSTYQTTIALRNRLYGN